MATRLAPQRNFVTITPTTNQSSDLSDQMSPSRNGPEIITITSTGNTTDTTVNRNGLQPVSDFIFYLLNLFMDKLKQYLN